MHYEESRGELVGSREHVEDEARSEAGEGVRCEGVMCDGMGIF